MYEILRKLNQITKLAPYIGWNNGGIGPVLSIVSVSFQNDVKVPYNTSWALASASLPSTVTVTLENSTTTSISVVWIQGSYNATTAQAYGISGTFILPQGISNPNNLSADITLEVNHEGYNILTQSANNVYYDFANLYSSAVVLQTGDTGLQDLGLNGYDAVPLNGIQRGRLTDNNINTYGLSCVNDDCVSTGNTLQPILSANRIDIFLLMATTDGIPVSTTTLLGGTAPGPLGLNIFNNSGRINVSYSVPGASFSWQSNVCLVNNNNVGALFHLILDFTNDTVTLNKDEVNIGGSFTASNISAVNPALYNCPSNIYVGATNANGSVGTHAEIVTIFRAAICANLSPSNASTVSTYLRFYRYPFSTFYIPFLIGDSQSEGAAEAGRMVVQGIYTRTPAQVLVYFKTSRTSADNGSWQGLNAGTNNKIVTGDVYSEDVPLTRNIQLHFGDGHNVHLVKGDQGGQLLNTDFDPPSGNMWVVATQYYWNVAKTKLLNTNPGKRIKPIISIDLGTNDSTTGGSAVTNFSSNLSDFITALRAHDSLFSTCPIFWCELNTILNATQISMNTIIKNYCDSNLNMYYISGDVVDDGDVLIRKRKQDLTVPEKLGVVATTSGGDDAHRSYLGMNAKGEFIYNKLIEIGYI